MTARGHSCLVEIAVTHFVDEEKARRIKEIGFPIFEIDLSDFEHQEFSREELAKAVLYNPDNRTWIYNPQAEKWAKDEYLKLLHSAEREIKQIKQSEKKKQKRKIGEKRIKDIFEPENYKKAVLSLKNERDTTKQLEKLQINVDSDTFPFFLNIPISGEMVFHCDRRIWQSELFKKFVYNRNIENDKKPSVHIQKVIKWVRDYNSHFQIDWGLTYKTVISTTLGEEKTVSLLYDVISTFFDYLAYLGFLEPFSYQNSTVTQTHSLLSPNKEHADILYEALKKVDWCSPNVDDQISQIIDSKHNTLRRPLLRKKAIISGESTSEKNSVPSTSSGNAALEQEIKYNAGLEDVQSKDFEGNELIYDRFGRRWLKCTNCGKLYRDDQMAIYGGNGSRNKGICRECSNNRR